jgi:ribA/ribD-fused uncharacterized protein
MRQTVETQYAIRGFFEKYRPLSNYDTTPFKIDEHIFKSGEHAFHYYKTINPEWRQKILEAETPSEAKKLGRICPMRPDWETNKVDIIRKVLFHKFDQNPDLKELLLSTGFKYLEETNDWNDTFWGVCNGAGENNLGKILMYIRAQFLIAENEHR